MPVLVHLSDQKNQAKIISSGIKIPKGGYGIYFMPHSDSFTISHQWARELKRSGIKNFIAIDFRVSSDELVWFGKFHEQHKQISLSKAISTFMNEEDKLGYEFFIERSITAKEILKVRKISKPIGWRYEPKAHGKEPCPCPMCIQFGGYKTSKLKEKNEQLSKKEAIEILTSSNDEDLLTDAASILSQSWRKESPIFLERLLESDDDFFLYSLVDLLMKYRHPLAKEYLLKLEQTKYEEIKEYIIERRNESN